MQQLDYITNYEFQVYQQQEYKKNVWKKQTMTLNLRYRKFWQNSLA
jgi:hypothetical protein